MAIAKSMWLTKFASEMLTVINDKLSFASNSLSLHVLHASTRAGMVVHQNRFRWGKQHAQREDGTRVHVFKLGRGFSYWQYIFVSQSEFVRCFCVAVCLCM